MQIFFEQFAQNGGTFLERKGYRISGSWSHFLKRLVVSIRQDETAQLSVNLVIAKSTYFTYVLATLWPLSVVYLQKNTLFHISFNASRVQVRKKYDFPHAVAETLGFSANALVLAP